MSFTIADLKAYEAQPAVDNPNHDPWAGTNTAATAAASPQAKAEADVDAAIAASVTEPAEQGNNDGSTTETKAETVAANDANPEGAKDPELEDFTDGKPRSRAQERIEELVAERNALRDYGKYLLDQVKSQRTGGPQTGTESQTVTTNKEQDDSAPTLEGAEFDPIKFAKQQNEWIDKQVAKRVESALKQFETRQSEVAIRSAFEQRAAEFSKSVPDFGVVIANPALPQLAPEAAKVVVRSDNGPAIAYHLAKNPDMAMKISRLEPLSQAVAIGRLEESLVRSKAEASTQKEPSKEAAKPVVKQAAVTKAPPPPKPVGSGSSVVTKDEGIMSMEEWVANDRNKKLAERAARKQLRAAMR
jgi:hypothetical protein